VRPSRTRLARSPVKGGTPAAVGGKVTAPLYGCSNNSTGRMSPHRWWHRACPHWPAAAGGSAPLARTVLRRELRSRADSAPAGTASGFVVDDHEGPVVVAVDQVHIALDHGAVGTGGSGVGLAPVAARDGPLHGGESSAEGTSPVATAESIRGSNIAGE